MTYVVIRSFADMNDCSEEFPNGRIYNVGDIVPTSGVTKTRLRELSTSDNRAGFLFIKLVEEGDEENGATETTETTGVEDEGGTEETTDSTGDNTFTGDTEG